MSAPWGGFSTKSSKNHETSWNFIKSMKVMKFHKMMEMRNSAPFPPRVRNVLYFLRNSIDFCTPFSPREGKIKNFMKFHEFYIKS